MDKCNFLKCISDNGSDGAEVVGERAAKQSWVITITVIRIESQGKTEFLLVQSAVIDAEELGKKQSKILRKFIWAFKNESVVM